MLLSRSWLNEFVDLSEVNDHDFSEAMTLSGSKVETVERLEAAGCEILDTRECGEIVFRGENVGREPDLLYNKENIYKEIRNANP